MAGRKRTSKSTTAVDVHIGKRVRERRVELGLSQEHLGTHIGVSFQQVQKYENGTNRIGPSRLVRAAEFLEAPLSYFFPNDSNAIARPPDPEPLKKRLRPLLKQLQGTLDAIEKVLE